MFLDITLPFLPEDLFCLPVSQHISQRWKSYDPKFSVITNRIPDYIFSILNF